MTQTQTRPVNLPQSIDSLEGSLLLSILAFVGELPTAYLWPVVAMVGAFALAQALRKAAEAKYRAETIQVAELEPPVLASLPKPKKLGAAVAVLLAVGLFGCASLGEWWAAPVDPELQTVTQGSPAVLPGGATVTIEGVPDVPDSATLELPSGATVVVEAPAGGDPQTNGEAVLQTSVDLLPAIFGAKVAGLTVLLRLLGPLASRLLNPRRRVTAPQA